MKQARFQILFAQYFLSASVGSLVLLTATDARALSIVATGSTTYSGISCDNLEAVYKRAYLSTGFKFKYREEKGESFSLIFDFQNPARPRKLSGHGELGFYRPEGNQSNCAVYVATMGGLERFDEYSSKEYDAFLEKIRVASEKSEALVRRELGRKVSSHKSDPPVIFDMGNG